MSSRREDKRKRIIDAAVDVFADKGFFQAKVSEIAEAAGVADGTIYLYFKSKDDLLISLFREKMNEILQRFSAIRDEGSPEQQLRRYIAEHLAFVAEKPKPPVPVRKSVQNDYIICLEDGQKFKSLKRHLMTHYGMTPEEYREKWDLPADYPMVAPAYAEARSRLAKEMGLGQRRKGK